MFFVKHSCFFDDPADVGNLICGSSAFSKTSLDSWMFMVHVLLKPDLENFEHYFARVWDECKHVVVWTFFVIAFPWDWSGNWSFPVLWPLLRILNLLTYWMQHFHSIIFSDLHSSAGIPSPPLDLFVVMLPKAHLTLHSRMPDFRWVITLLWLSASLKHWKTLLQFLLNLVWGHVLFDSKKIL